MSKPKDTAAPQEVASILNGIADRIATASLSKAERKRLQTRSESVPDALVEMVIHLADENGGNVLGVAFDAAVARKALADVSATRTAIAIGRQLLQRMEDDLVQQRAALADPTFALYTALRRLVNTPGGNKLKPAYAQMRDIVKNRPRRSRSKKTVPAPPSPAAPSPSGDGATKTGA